MYDPDPTIHTVSGRGDRYIAVLHADGRIDGFSREFPAGTTVGTAIGLVSADMPPGTNIVWKQRFDSCYQVEYESPALAVAAPGFGAWVSVGFYHYDQEANPLPVDRVVEEAIVDLGKYPTPASAPAC